MAKIKIGEPFKQSGSYFAQITAIEDIPIHNVKAGDIGGLISFYSEDQFKNFDLYIRDNAWVGQGCIAYHTEMKDNAIINGQVFVENSVLQGNSRIEGFATVKNSALTDNALITSKNLAEHDDKRYDEREHPVVVIQTNMLDNSIVSTGSNISSVSLKNDDHAKMLIGKSFNFKEFNKLSFEIVGLELVEYQRYMRIRATRDIPSQNVKKGDLGGLISNITVSHMNQTYYSLQDNAWVAYGAISDNSIHTGNSRVDGNATLTKCITREDSLISGGLSFLNCEFSNSVLINFYSKNEMVKKTHNGKVILRKHLNRNKYPNRLFMTNDEIDLFVIQNSESYTQEVGII